MRLLDVAAGVLMHRYGMDQHRARTAAKEVMEALDRDLNSDQLASLGVDQSFMNLDRLGRPTSGRETGYRKLMRDAASGLV